MDIYERSTIYTFIPKNACSTLRYSIAIANGCLEPGDDVNWIHANNTTFEPTLKSLIEAKYTFVILRCPYRRIVSVFLNKFLNREPASWLYYLAIKRQTNLDDLTFEAFVESLQMKVILNTNNHWRPQNDFLVYKNYDDYFCIEEFDTLKQSLQDKINLTLYDTRNALKHDLSNRATLEHPNASTLTTLDLVQMKRQGKLPLYSSFYTERLIAIVKKVYKQDLELYKSKFGETNLLFQ